VCAAEGGRRERDSGRNLAGDGCRWSPPAVVDADTARVAPRRGMVGMLALEAMGMLAWSR
jgi:hypothetical protein